MDNLTHSLVGALFGQMGLKRKTGLAMPTLIIAANIPDIDAVAVLLRRASAFGSAARVDAWADCDGYLAAAALGSDAVV